MDSYTVIRSGRRTVGLEIRPDLSLVIRAPFSASEKQIDEVVQKHRVWIEKTRNKLRGRVQRPPVTPEEETRLRAQARQLLPVLVEQYAQQLHLYPTAVRVTGAATRFGSCSAKNSICFSFRLMQYPLAAIEYVVVHELCHIRHKNHGPAFYRLIESVLPDYRARQQMLKN